MSDTTMQGGYVFPVGKSSSHVLFKASELAFNMLTVLSFRLRCRRVEERTKDMEIKSTLAKFFNGSGNHRGCFCIIAISSDRVGGYAYCVGGSVIGNSATPERESLQVRAASHMIVLKILRLAARQLRIAGKTCVAKFPDAVGELGQDRYGAGGSFEALSGYGLEAAQTTGCGSGGCLTGAKLDLETMRVGDGKTLAQVRKRGANDSGKSSRWVRGDAHTYDVDSSALCRPRVSPSPSG
nr:hypothetical protein Iba_chr02cCG6190 [Ipomoea batatas]